MRPENLQEEPSKIVNIYISVIGLSGTDEVKGAVGVGKSSICNRLVRPEHFNQKQISTLSSVDFHSDIINGTNWIYWNSIVEKIDSKIFSFHFIEQTVLINDQTFMPFENESESNYVSRATSDKIVGSKRAYISPVQFSKSEEIVTVSVMDHKSCIDAFIVVFDVSEVNSRDYQAQDRVILKLLTVLQKSKKPTVIALSKTDIKSTKIRARFDSIIEKHNFKSIPVIETSAKLNINISSIPSIIVSELQTNHRPLTLKIIKKPYKIHSFDEEFSRQQNLKEELLIKYRYLVSEEVSKVYDLSWEEFCSRYDLSFILGNVGKSQLLLEFECCKEHLIKKINESLMLSFSVLFKQILFEFLPLIMTKEYSTDENVLSTLLLNPLFVQKFQEQEVEECIVLSKAHISGKIDYPLPRFLINNTHPSNILHLINYCIEEIKLQRIKENFSKEFLKTLESNQEMYENMSFEEVENKFRDRQKWNHFRDVAKSIFSEFIVNCINKFKVLFDEKLLELSFMIFMFVPVKSCMRKCNIKEKDYKESIPDMDMIKNINNKIYFDNIRYDKNIYQKQRIIWVVKYIGSLISSNPCQCYHFEFNSVQCQENLLRYLEPSKKFIGSVVNVISCDESVDRFWKSTVSENMITIASKFVSSIQFIPSYEINKDSFWTHSFSCCQKIIILIKEIKNEVNDIVDQLINKDFIYPGQISIINIEYSSTNTIFLPKNILTRKNGEIARDSCCLDNNFICDIKDQASSYICQSETIFIWIIVICDDRFDCSIPVSFFLSLFKEYIILEHQQDEFMASMSMVYMPNIGDMPQRLNLAVLSYHQAFKLLNDECQCFNLHLLMYFCEINRLASINTTFAVMKNVQTIFQMKSVICAIKSSNFSDYDEFQNRKKMVEDLALDNNIMALILDNQGGSEKDYHADSEVTIKIMAVITNCVRSANCMDQSKELCRDNTAYEYEEQMLEKCSKNSHSCFNSDFCKDNIEKVRPNDNMQQHSSFGSRDRTFSQSDSPLSPDINFSDQFFGQDHGKMSSVFVNIDYCDSVALGCHNEHLFRVIQEESSFCDEVQDTSTIVLINCTNSEHKEVENEVNSQTKNQQSSKFRSFSGPVPMNKSFQRKYSTTQNPMHRSQRYLTLKSQSLSTSPVTISMKSYSQPQIVCSHCKGSNDCCVHCQAISATAQNRPIPPSKSFRNALSRFFSSDRCNSKSADEKRSIFRRSIKFPKRNSDKKIKNIPTSNSSCEGLSHRSPQSSGSFILHSLHSTSSAVSDTRTRTKSATKPIFSL